MRINFNLVNFTWLATKIIKNVHLLYAMITNINDVLSSDSVMGGPRKNLKFLGKVQIYYMHNEANIS